MLCLSPARELNDSWLLLDHQNHPTRADTTKPHNETSPRRARQDSRVSHRSTAHRSSSAVFRALPPIRRMPSLQVPSLTDLSNPHHIPNPRSLKQISETEATTFKLKLPLTLVHPNSPYVPWDTPVREQILCNTPLAASPEDSSAPAKQEPDLSASDLQTREEAQRDKKALSSVWSALKSAPKRVKSKCRLLLGPRVRDPTHGPAAEFGPGSSNTSRMRTDLSHLGDDDEDQAVMSYLPQPHIDMPLSPTASFRSTETNSLAVWLSERQRKFLDKDCESTRLMTVDEYERVGSWIKPGDLPSFAASRTSYQCSFISDQGDAVSGVLTVYESEGDLGGLSPASWTSNEHQHMRTGSPSASRTAVGPKRIGEEDRLSRIVHRASLLSYIAERPLSSANEWNVPSSP